LRNHIIREAGPLGEETKPTFTAETQISASQVLKSIFHPHLGVPLRPAHAEESRPTAMRGTHSVRIGDRADHSWGLKALVDIVAYPPLCLFPLPSRPRALDFQRNLARRPHLPVPYANHTRMNQWAIYNTYETGDKPDWKRSSNKPPESDKLTLEVCAFAIQLTRTVVTMEDNNR
jgi:hypothetical protein